MSTAVRASRILVVINRLLERGGAEGSTTLIVDGLHDASMRFGVVTLHELDPVPRARLEARGVRFWESGPGFVEQWETVSDAIRAFRPDLVHATLFDAELVACVAGLVHGVPVVRSVVNTPYDADARAAARSPMRLRATQAVDAALARYATYRFHAISQTTAESAVRSLGIDRARVDVVPRGREALDLGEPTVARRDAVRAALGIDPRSFVLLNVARQDPQKGQVYLLDAFARAREAIPDAVLLVAGREGPETPRLRALVAERGLEGAVQFLGMRDDVADLLTACDAFVFSSLWEGLGGALLEAMAMGVPIVAFDAPAVAEALGGTGMVVARRDAPAMAAAIVAVAESADLRADLARRTRERFALCFTNEASLAGMRDLYSRAIRARPDEFHDPLLRARRRGTGSRSRRCAS